MNNEKVMSFIVKESVTVVEAMQKIDMNAHGILFVVDDAFKLVGVITDGDIRRWLIKTGNLQSKINEIMNKTPKVIHRKDISLAQEIMKMNSITALPLVDSKGKIKDVILRAYEYKVEESIKKDKLDDVAVIVMAGGKGTRLYPYTKILPKPLIPIGDIPIMERIMNRFCEYGVTKFYTTVNYRKSMIKSYFSDIDKNYEIEYVEEDKPLGTAGSLRLICDEFTKPVIVTNCDILIHANYADIYKYHVESGNELTIVSALKNIVVPYGVIQSKENGIVTSMEEKPKLSYFVNTGMYVLNADIIRKIPDDTFFHMTDLASLLLEENRKVGMYPISEESFLDMGEFEEMRRMEQKLNLQTE